MEAIRRIGSLPYGALFFGLLVSGEMDEPTLSSVTFNATFVALSAAIGFRVGFDSSFQRFPAVVSGLMALTCGMTTEFTGPPVIERFFMFGLFAIVITATVAIPILNE